MTSFKFLNLEFQDAIKVWYLDIEVKDINEFWNSLVCIECHKPLSKGEITYYCQDNNCFFHRDCCIKSKHNVIYQNVRNPDHEDFRVIIYPQEVKEVLDDKIHS